MIPYSAERSDMDFELKRDDKFREPDFIDEGMKVVAPYIHNGNRIGLRCVVSIAAGYHAQVSCESRQYKKWFHISELRIEC